MRLTQFSNFALRILMFAGLKGRGPSSIPEIARAYPNSSADVRSIEDISLPELSAAIRGCIDAADPLTDAARRFGVKRLSAAARDRLKMAKPVTGHIRE